MRCWESVRPPPRSAPAGRAAGKFGHRGQPSGVAGGRVVGREVAVAGGKVSDVTGGGIVGDRRGKVSGNASREVAGVAGREGTDGAVSGGREEQPGVRVGTGEGWAMSYPSEAMASFGVIFWSA